MIKVKSLANAVTIVFTAAYVICGIITFIAPDLFWMFADSWFHNVNLEALKATSPMSVGSFIFGIITFAVYVWIISFAIGILYNRFSKGRS